VQSSTYRERFKTAGAAPIGPRVDGRLRLRFEAKRSGKRTILADCEQHLPMRIIRAFQLDDGGALVHLHNVSGGVLGGDRLEVVVEAGAKAVAQITSTGATRIYRSRKDVAPAELKLFVNVADDGLVEYLPDPLIPFAGSRCRQETRIELGANAGLFWWETVSPGREACHEQFAYELLQLKTTIMALGCPIALEHNRIEPAQRPLLSLARLGSYRYFSTFYICHSGIQPRRWLELEKLLEQLGQSLSRSSQIIWGVTTLRRHGLVVRALSRGGWDITAHLPKFWNLARRYLYGRTAALPRKLY